MGKENKKKKSGMVKKVAGLLAGAVFGAAMGFGIEKGFIEGKISNVEMEPAFFFGMLLALGLAYLINIAFHELGHVVFGLLTGFKFISYRFLSFVIYKKDGKLIFGRFHIPGTAGQALLYPPKVIDGKYHYVWYNLGGVLFNLILAGVGIVGIQVSNQWFISFFWGSNILFGLIMALGNGIPYSKNGMSDGCNLYVMARYKECRPAFYLQLEMVGKLSSGYTWADFKEEDFAIEECEAIKYHGFMIAPKLYRISLYYQNRKFEKAKSLMDECMKDMDGYGPIYQKVIMAETLFCTLITGGTKEEVEQLYTKDMQKYLKMMKYEVSSYRNQMAYEWLYNEDDKKAEEYYRRGIEAAKHYPYAGDAALEVGILEYMHEKMDARENLPFTNEIK